MCMHPYTHACVCVSSLVHLEKPALATQCLTRLGVIAAIFHLSRARCSLGKGVSVRRAKCTVCIEHYYATSTDAIVKVYTLSYKLMKCHDTSY